MSAILRWPGGKSWAIKSVLSVLKDVTFVDYHEPFLGGGSIFLSMNQINNAYLSDINEELINFYSCVKADIYRIIRILSGYKNEEWFYYKIRASKPRNEFRRAARFIYLNKTCFNGIYRENIKGEFNVPYGGYGKRFLEVDRLLMLSEKLKMCDLSVGDFEQTLRNIKKNDLVILDPPYAGTSKGNGGFVKYNKNVFVYEDQRRLARYINEINELGAWFVLFNSADLEIVKLFDGFKKSILERYSRVSGVNDGRKTVTEMMFTNIHEEKSK